MTGTFACLPSRGASGGVAVWAREGTGRNNWDQYGPVRNPHLDLGVAEYFVDLPKAGRYQLFLRMWAGDPCSNSCWVEIDRDRHYFPGGLRGRFGAKRWEWPDKMFRRWFWIDDDTYVYRLKAGPHRVRLEVREDGVAIDQVALAPRRRRLPDGPAVPTLRPGLADWSGVAAFSTDTPSTGRSGTVTPFDAFLCVDSHCLAPAAALSVHGWLWLRSNTTKPQALSVGLACDEADLGPSPTLHCRLSEDAPVARVPLNVVFPSTVRRRTFDLAAVVMSDAWPKLVVKRSCRLVHPLDWRVLGPLGAEETALVEAARPTWPMDALPDSPVPSRPDLRWIRALPEKHFNAFGALDLNRLLGRHHQATAYLAARIEVEAPDTYRVVAAGDDDLRLWCGGRMLVDERQHGPLVDAIRPYSVELPAGEQWLVARLTQLDGPWNLLVWFEDARGNATARVYGPPLSPP